VCDVVRTAPQVLAEADWTARERRHAERVEAFVAPHAARARRGEAHPVWDFLFTYYNLKPRHLRRWNPGFGVALAGPSARDRLGRAGYVAHGPDVTVSAAYLQSRVDTIGFVARLLRATAARPARLNCFGLHEWAMVYRTPEVRHAGVPLRLGSTGTDAVVDSMPLRCSHFDAFRFFSEPASQRNSEPLSRDTQVSTEQPGCLHAGMDLYKWSFKLGPLMDSELVLDCLELAATARVLDMRASPYDLRDYGFTPIAIETPAGRAEYVRLQQEVASRATPLRATLVDRCEALLIAARAS
jgi:hypothetical protein